MSDPIQKSQQPHTGFSLFTNSYILTKEMCAEAEPSRIDIDLAYVCMTLLFVFMVFLSSVPDLLPSIPDAAYRYFSNPSAGTILELSGTVGITFISPVVAIVCLLKAFPKLVGEKRFQENLKFIPSANRTLSFYEDCVIAEGGLRKKLSWEELRRTGETRNLYLLYFTDKRILPVDKHGFRKGDLRELKALIRKHRTPKSRIYGIVRYVPLALYFLLFCLILWLEWSGI